MSSPDIDIIICAYQTGERIRATIDAILAQTYENFRLLIIDDASGDDTVDIIREYEDQRVQLVENEVNMGVVASRNKGLALAEADFIATCDHDDHWKPEKLALQIAYMQAHEECGLVGCFWDRYKNEQYDSTASISYHSSAYIGWYLYYRNCLLHSGLLFRRSVVEACDIEYSSDVTFGDDWKLCLDFANAGEVGVVPESLVKYTLHGDNWSIKAREEMHASGASVLKNAIEKLLGQEISVATARLYFDAVVIGVPQEDMSKLIEAGEMLATITARYIERNTVSLPDAENIYRSASEIWWQMVRLSASVKGPKQLQLFDRISAFGKYKPGLGAYITAWGKAAIKSRM
ncbi:glycosyltransferase [Kordiimonas sp. SCSIO 12603]|uniref:glycosyltransferase family 2 protein n=1 Tax=Kordiimonas sp. SCSIO 12603 TaxID=2829596 RepID=UPI002105B3CB|nr:glycosyltransferase [Kordiimonas sp. SCSIO 12603]UTW59026.1 glycosyltransferase [Kordiimonas sp. SCSIO 12603]